MFRVFARSFCYISYIRLHGSVLFVRFFVHFELTTRRKRQPAVIVLNPAPHEHGLGRFVSLCLFLLVFAALGSVTWDLFSPSLHEVISLKRSQGHKLFFAVIGSKGGGVHVLQ